MGGRAAAPTFNHGLLHKAPTAGAMSGCTALHCCTHGGGMRAPYTAFSNARGAAVLALLLAALSQRAWRCDVSVLSLKMNLRRAPRAGVDTADQVEAQFDGISYAKGASGLEGFSLTSARRRGHGGPGGGAVRRHQLREGRVGAAHAARLPRAPGRAAAPAAPLPAAGARPPPCRSAAALAVTCACRQ